MARLTGLLGICATLLAAAGAQAAGGHDLMKEPQRAPPEWRSRLETEARSMPFSRGRLLRISKGGKTSYLLGALHTSDARLSDLSPQTVDAISKARLLALELPETEHMKEADLHAIREALLATDDRRASHLLPLEDYISLVGAFGKCKVAGLPVEQLKAFAIALTADDRRCGPDQSDAGLSAEQRLTQLAREHSVPIMGLETLVEQIQAADGLPREVDRALLEAIMRRAPYSADIEETEAQLYLDRDPGLLLAWMKCDEPIPGVSGAGLPPSIFERLITRRNHRMSSRAAPLLEKGDAFIAIGAAHLPGPEGVAQLLADRGFLVEVLE